MVRSPLTAVMILALTCCGCALLRVGPAVRVEEVRSEDHANKNLAAIRDLQADRRWPNEGRTSNAAAGQGTFPANRGSAPTMKRPSDEAAHGSTPSSNPVRSKSGDPIATLPWTPPSVSPPAQSDRLVPSYTIPAPAGPDHGSIRCVPDGLAGQRCLTP